MTTQLITAHFGDMPVLFQADGFINATAIAKQFNKVPKDFLRTESTKDYIKAIGQICLIDENQIGYMIITQKDFIESDAIESDTENFVNFILSVQDVRLGMLFIELKNGFKVSFRSKGRLPVNKLAGLFGGGGHQNASGARFREGKMSDMIPKILSEAEKFFNNYSKG